MDFKINIPEKHMVDKIRKKSLSRHYNRRLYFGRIESGRLTGQNLADWLTKSEIGYGVLIAWGFLDMSPLVLAFPRKRKWHRKRNRS